MVVEPLVALASLALDTELGLTVGVLVVVLLTTGSLRLDLPRLPLPRLRLLVLEETICPPKEGEGELGRERRGDSLSVGVRGGRERERERERRRRLSANSVNNH